MKIAVSSTGPGLDDAVDPRFGRCKYYIAVDPQSMQFEAFDNTSALASGGAGIAAAQAIAQKGVDLVLTGNCGPNAHSTLSATGVQVITGVSGTVREVIDKYNTGKYQASAQPNVPDHYGIGNTGAYTGGAGMGANIGMRQGMGRGMRRGMGRGMGWQGMGMGTGVEPGMVPDTEQMKAPAPFSGSREEEVQWLKSQSASLTQQAAEMQRRIEKLEKTAKKKGE